MTKTLEAAEAQVAMFSYRIAHLTEHLKKNRKDFHTQRALIKLVGKRRKLLDYLSAKGHHALPRNCVQTRLASLIMKF